MKTHDIGIILRRNDKGALGYEVLAGGGQGRTPYLAQTIRDFVPEHELLPYVEAMIRVYNLHGRRDNKYKARIKILLAEMGLEQYKKEVEQEFENHPPENIALPQSEIDRINAYFAPPAYDTLPETSEILNKARSDNQEFNSWCKHNLGAT